MIDVNKLRKGTNFTIDDEIYKVLDYRHHKPGRGKATIRCSVRNLRSGSTTEMTFTSGDSVQDIRVETLEVEYLYPDGEFLVFMDTTTYEQPQLRRDIFGDDVSFLTENMKLKLSSYEDEIIDYILPSTVDHEVAEADAAVAGDTATGATKKVKTVAGLMVTVPLFVEIGDTIRVNTESGEYITRV